MKKKLLAMVMTLAMVLSLVPVTALAEEMAAPEEQVEVLSQDEGQENPVIQENEEEAEEEEESEVAVQAAASEFTVDGLTYQVTESKDSVNVIQWDGKSTDVIIPAEVTDDSNNTYRVVGISASSGFKNSQLTSIDIQAEIEMLEDATFSGCTSLTTVKLPGTITKIGNSAFQNCKGIKEMTGIEWSKVTSIGANAFDSAFAMDADKIAFSEESLRSIQELGASAFKYATNLTGQVVIPEGIEKIGSNTFNKTGITQLVLPNSLQKIGAMAFCNCNLLESIHIGSNKGSQLINIEMAAFGNDVSVTSFVIETNKDNINIGIKVAIDPFQRCKTQPTYTIKSVEGDNIAEGDTLTLQEAINQAQDGDIIVIKRDISLTTEVLVENKKVTITDEGKGFTITTGKEFLTPMFRVTEGSTLTLDGNIEYDCTRMTSGCVVKVEGTCVLESGTIFNMTDSKAVSTGAIDVCGGNFTMKGGKICKTKYVSPKKEPKRTRGTIYIHDNGEFIMNNGSVYEAQSGGYYSGAIYVSESGTITMNGGKISSSESTGMYTASVVLDGSDAYMTMNAGEISENSANLEDSTPGVLIMNGASFEMNGGTIANNQGLRGAGVLVGTTDIETYNADTASKFTMNGGTISENTASSKYGLEPGGAGVFVQNNAEFIMNDGTISENKVGSQGMGGGVATFNPAQNGGGCFTMNGGTISGNSANSGGGVYSHSKDTVILRGGYILNNRAGSNGGGVYVSKAPYNITLENALVTDNMATIMGGGVWSCPTGTVRLGADSAVYDNTANGAGDDLAFLNKEASKDPNQKNPYYSTFTDSILGNGKVVWYRDNSINGNSGVLGSHSNWRYNAEKPGEPVLPALESIDNYSLKAMVTEDSKNLAEGATSHLFVQGNTAARGGGVGTNGEVIFSGATTTTEPMKVIVNKVWKNDNGNHPSMVTVNLIRTTKDGKETAKKISSVTLSAENQWTYTFDNLSVDYTYSVTEDAVSRYTTEITKNKTEDKYTVSYTITNTYRRGGGGGGSSTVDIPDEDVPTGLDLKNHYGYIIGYPVDYYTGEPTTDQTKKPVRPEGKITRAEVATIYFRMLTEENRAANWNQVSGFSDVKSKSWYNNAISTLTKAGILEGYEDGTFRPNGYITRAEFATIAIRFFSGVYEGEDLFPDIKDHWARDYINNAADKGLVKGYEDGTFGPDRYITRAEAVTLVNRTLNRHPDKDCLHEDMLVWPDNMDTSKWYYADMQEATNSHEPDKDKSDSEKEYWSKTLPIRDWEALEKEWSNANSAPGEGEVV